jgi:hypothetical protein
MVSFYKSSHLLLEMTQNKEFRFWASSLFRTHHHHSGANKYWESSKYKFGKLGIDY